MPETHSCATGTKCMMDTASEEIVLASSGSTMMEKSTISSRTRRMASTRLTMRRGAGPSSGFPFLFLWLSSLSNRCIGTLRMNARHAPTMNGDSVASTPPRNEPMAATCLTQSTSATVKAERASRKRFVFRDRSMESSLNGEAFFSIIR